MKIERGQIALVMARIEALMMDARDVEITDDAVVTRVPPQPGDRFEKWEATGSRTITIKVNGGSI